MAEVAEVAKTICKLAPGQIIDMPDDELHSLIINAR